MIKKMPNQNLDLQQGLFRLVIEIIKSNPPLTQLSLKDSGFSYEQGEDIREELAKSLICTIKIFEFSKHPRWFN